MFPLLLTLALGPAMLPAPDGEAVCLTVSDPVLVTSSTDVIDGVIGQSLVFDIEGPPTGPAFVGFSPTPPFGAGSINGVPIEIDPATAFYPAFGVQLSLTGEFVYETPVPAGLIPGTSFWSQAAVIDPAGGQLLLTNGVRIDLRDPLPGDLPHLPAGHHVGLHYSTPPATAAPTMDAAWLECTAAGVDSYALSLAWTDIELAPGMYSTAELTSQLALAAGAGLMPYLNLTTIDGPGLTLPSDLLDPADPAKLAPGLTWDSTVITSRFQSVLDIVTPSLVASGGFFLAIGDEVDRYLVGHQGELAAYASFVQGAATYVHATQPTLGVGVSLTYEAAVASGPVLTSLRAASDNLAWTYYPLEPDHTPRPPSVVGAEIDLLSQVVAPRPLILQEVGYPAGYQPTPGNGSSPELQRQFVEQLFDAVLAHPKLRFLGLVALGDVDAATATSQAAAEGSTAPLFVEHLATLGLREHATGAAKPAYAQLLLELGQLP